MKLVSESVSQSNAELIKEYFDVTEQIKLLEKKKEQIKPLVKAVAKTPIFVVGEFIVSKSVRSKSALDKQGLMLAVGADVVKEFEVMTSYEVLEVKKVNQ